MTLIASGSSKTLRFQNRRDTLGWSALVPSFNRTKDWKSYGAIVANKDTVSEIIDGLKRGAFEKAVVLARIIRRMQADVA